MSQPHSTKARLGAAIAVALALLVLDLLFLGVIARPIYDEALGALRSANVFWPAALAFYAMYVSAIVVHAVEGAATRRDALRRGAGLGFVAYATYELTNWAVLAGWPGWLAPIDIAWGVVLTASVSWVGKVVADRLSEPVR